MHTYTRTLYADIYHGKIGRKGTMERYVFGFPQECTGCDNRVSVMVFRVSWLSFQTKKTCHCTYVLPAEKRNELVFVWYLILLGSVWTGPSRLRLPIFLQTTGIEELRKNGPMTTSTAYRPTTLLKGCTQKWGEVLLRERISILWKTYGKQPGICKEIKFSSF